MCSSNIFLGETFCGFVTVHNDSQETVKEVVLKVSSDLSKSFFQLHRSGDCMDMLDGSPMPLCSETSEAQCVLYISAGGAVDTISARSAAHNSSDV